MTKIHILHCGEVLVDELLPFGQGKYNPKIIRDESHQVWLPVSAYLIEHPKGLILVDTGWHTDVITNQKEHLGPIQSLICKAKLNPNQSIDKQIKLLGFEIKDIDYVLISHMHTDHVSGLALVKDAKNILVSDLEIEETLNRPERYVKSMWEGITTKPFSFSKTGIGPAQLSYDLFDDNSITLINAPGHTKGLFAVKISNNNNEYVILASDMGYSSKSWRNLILPGISINESEVYEGLLWLQNIERDKKCIKVIANHDIDIIPQAIEF